MYNSLLYYSFVVVVVVVIHFDVQSDQLLQSDSSFVGFP